MAVSRHVADNNGPEEGPGTRYKRRGAVSEEAE